MNNILTMAYYKSFEISTTHFFLSKLLRHCNFNIPGHERGSPIVPLSDIHVYIRTILNIELLG